jgi:hypothetical protein
LPLAVLFNLEPGVIVALSASPLGELFRPGKLLIRNAGAGKIGQMVGASKYKTFNVKFLT